jgi:hypothetical protein
MAPLTLQSKIKIGSDILCREIEGEAVVLHAKTGVYYGLDPMGTRVWHLLQEDQALGRIHKTLQQEFEVQGERCEADLLKFANDLYKNGLVTLASSR